MIEQLAFLFTGLVLGILFAWLFFRQRARYDRSGDDSLLERVKTELGELKISLAEKEKEIVRLTADVASRDANITNLGEKLETQKKEVEEIKEKMQKEFRLIANEILSQNSEQLTKASREKLGEILNPFNENLKEFKKKVEDTYEKETGQRLLLEKEVKNLAEMNMQISKEAQALTRALKGDSKTQGNWGEMILESILEKSGLVKGREFRVQESHTDSENKRLQPDIVVDYPGDRSIIIDAKVSLTAYERYIDADEEDKEAELKAHMASIKSHINELASKKYQDLYDIKSLDFVMMFLPVEPAYLLAIQEDNQLWNYAFDKRILLISPTNLIAALKMIQSMWIQERQTRYVLDIAAQGGALYDDFVLLAERLIALGKKLDATQASYTDTIKKLKDGKGNIIGRVEKLKHLGAKAKKSMPEGFAENELPDSD